MTYPDWGNFLELSSYLHIEISMALPKSVASSAAVPNDPKSSTYSPLVQQESLHRMICFPIQLFRYSLVGENRGGASMEETNHFLSKVINYLKQLAAETDAVKKSESFKRYLEIMSRFWNC